MAVRKHLLRFRDVKGVSRSDVKEVIRIAVTGVAFYSSNGWFKASYVAIWRYGWSNYLVDQSNRIQGKECRRKAFGHPYDLARRSKASACCKTISFIATATSFGEAYWILTGFLTLNRSFWGFLFIALLSAAPGAQADIHRHANARSTATIYNLGTEVQRLSMDK